MAAERFLLDTHILVRLANGAVDERRNQLFERSDIALGYSVISLWEITKLYEKGRLGFLNGIADALRQIEGHPQLTAIPLSSGVLLAVLSASQKMHKDPADQMIVASAMHWGATLVTDDGELRKLEWIKTI